MKKPKPAKTRKASPRGVKAGKPLPTAVRHAKTHGGGKPAPPAHHHQHHHAHKPPKPKSGHVVKHAQHHKRRGLALGDAVACCSAEALAASLRLAGGPVTDSDVLALHYLAGGTENGGVSILATLETASEHGLAGARLTLWEMAEPDSNRHFPSLTVYGLLAERGARPPQLPAISGGSLILGVEMPGSHAVLANGDTWWSWGEPYCCCAFPDAVIEEAWTVEWEVTGALPA